MPPQMKVEKPVVHISLNPHPEDVLTDIELQNIARDYLEKLGFGNQPYLVFKHEDIDRHHLHIVTINVDENGKRLKPGFPPPPQRPHPQGTGTEIRAASG